MKVANIIVAHKNPAQLSRLLQQYADDRFINLVHIDKSIDLTPFSGALSQSNVRLIKRRRVSWAGNSFVRVVVDGMNVALTEKSVAYVSVMSGLDFPTKPVDQYYDLLQARMGEEYFQISSIADWPYNNQPIADRYERYHLSDWTMKGRYFAERWINRILPRRKFYGGLVPFGRSAWFTATRDFVQYAVKYFNEHPGYMRFLQYVWASDEFAFSTLVMNHDQFKQRISPIGNLRYIDWSEKKASPKTLQSSDFEKIISSDAFIGRKFDEQVDADVILKLMKHISATTVLNDERKA